MLITYLLMCLNRNNDVVFMNEFNEDVLSAYTDQEVLGYLASLLNTTSHAPAVTGLKDGRAEGGKWGSDGGRGMAGRWQSWRVNEARPEDKNSRSEGSNAPGLSEGQ